MEVKKSLKEHLTRNQKVYIVYGIVSIVVLSIIYVFLHKDLAAAEDVLVVLDLGALAFYQFLSMIVLSVIIVKKYIMEKKQGINIIEGVWNIVVPMFFVLLYPILYIVINYNSYTKMFGYFDLWEISVYLLYYFAGTVIGVIIHYYMLLLKNAKHSWIQLILPFLLIALYGIIFLFMGLLFELLVVRENLNTSAYFYNLNIFDNIAFSIMGLIALIMVYFVIKLYRKK